MIIRHGEKPLVRDGIAQIVPTVSSKMANILNMDWGWQRVGSLALLFASDGAKFRSKLLAAPNIIFASAIGPHSWSRWMQLTFRPLQQKLCGAVTVNTAFCKGKEERMVETALRCSPKCSDVLGPCGFDIDRRQHIRNSERYSVRVAGATVSIWYGSSINFVDRLVGPSDKSPNYCLLAIRRT